MRVEHFLHTSARRHPDKTAYQHRSLLLVQPVGEIDHEVTECF